jgi:hypothetical protein
MDETCDRCGPEVRAAYRVERDDGELYLCRLCASQLWPALSAQGWIIWVASELALAPQAADVGPEPPAEPAEPAEQAAGPDRPPAPQPGASGAAP